MKLNPLYKAGDPSSSEMSLDCEWVVGAKPDASDDRLFRCCELPGAHPVCWEAEWVEGIPLEKPWPLGAPSAERFYKESAPTPETAAALRSWLNWYESSSPVEDTVSSTEKTHPISGCSRPVTALLRWRQQQGLTPADAAAVLGLGRDTYEAIENCSQLPTVEQAQILEQHAGIPQGWWWPEP